MDTPAKVYEQALAEMEKKDKIGNALEVAGVVATSFGATFLIDRTVRSVYEPKNLAEKIFMELGIFSLGTAIGFGAAQPIHYITHPLENRKKQEIINKALVLAHKQIELSSSTVKMADAASKLVDTAHAEGEIIRSAYYLGDMNTDNLKTFNDIVNDVNVSVKSDVDVSVGEDKDGE